MKEQEVQNAEGWITVGQQHLRDKRYHEALAAFEQALSINENLAAAWCNRGRVKLFLQYYQDAIDDYNQALNSDCRNCPGGWCSRGEAKQALGRYTEAIADFDEAIRLKQHNPESLLNKSFSLIFLARYEEALKVCEQAIRIKPDFGDAHLNRAIAFHGLANYTAALKSYDQAIQYNEKAPKIWYNRGVTLKELKRYQDAASSYTQAIEFDQNQYWLAWSQLGQVTATLNGYKAAQEVWTQGIQKLSSALNIRNYLQGRAELYYTKGNSYSTEARQNRNPFPYWRSAQQCYGKALEYFEKLVQSYSYEMPLQERYLLTLREYIKTRCYMGISDIKLQKLLRDGTSRLKVLLHDANLPEKKKTKLALEFSTFSQLTVDYFIRDRQFQQALETAEKDKNACLTWMLGRWTGTVTSPTYEQITSHLLNSSTAIVYWHLSPIALTTFILKQGEAAPISIFEPNYTLEDSASFARLRLLEAWTQDWDQQYRDYCNQSKEQRNPEHLWRKEMQQRLFTRQTDPSNLKDILNISEIEQHLDGINHLILIPHRDLHRFPLHALFNSRFTTSYLPSAQAGLNLRGRSRSDQNGLLSVENPTSDRSSPLEFARVESQIIGQTFRAVIFIRESEATQETVLKALGQGCKILHFSGHGSHYPDNPQKSELLLAGTDCLTLQEICQLDLTTYDLVSLSACETALTHHQTITTEYVGLVSGFLESGVAQVISTLWVVESAVSALVMIEFYRRRSGKSDAVALAETIQFIRNLTREKFVTWCTERLAELPKTLPRERRLKIKRTLDHALARWGNIERDIQNPYSWAAFTLSGGFF